MKRIFLLPLLSVLVIFSCGNNENPEPGPEPDPPGPTPVYVDKPIRIEEVIFNGTIYEYLYEYDEQYRNTEYTFNVILESGEIDSTEIHQYTYNSHNDIASHKAFFDLGSNFDIVFDYEYDDKGNIVTQTEKGHYAFPVNYRYTFTYDEYNRLTLENIYDEVEASKDIPDQKYKYTYTEGKQYKDYEKMEYYDPSTADEPYWTITNEFDEEGKGLVVKTVDTLTGEVITNEYDEYGNLFKQTVEESEVKEKRVYTYEYYKNMPDKPLVIKEEDYIDIGYERLISMITTVSEYDAHDRVKKETKTDGLPEDDPRITTTTYYYEFE